MLAARVTLLVIGAILLWLTIEMQLAYFCLLFLGSLIGLALFWDGVVVVGLTETRRAATAARDDADRMCEERTGFTRAEWYSVYWRDREVELEQEIDEARLSTDRRESLLGTVRELRPGWGRATYVLGRIYDCSMSEHLVQPGRRCWRGGVAVAGSDTLGYERGAVDAESRAWDSALAFRDELLAKIAR